jgi:hypothetical protein
LNLFGLSHQGSSKLKTLVSVLFWLAALRAVLLLLVSPWLYLPQEGGMSNAFLG